MKMRRILSIILVLCLCVGLSAAFAEGGEYDETLSFTAYIQKQGDDSFPMVEWPSYQAMLKATEDYMGMNIDIQYTMLPGAEFNERMNIYIASGDLHDVFATGGNWDLVDDLAEGGQIVNLLDYEDQLVNLLPRLEDNNGLKIAQGYEDGIWGFPYFQHASLAGSQYVWMIRVDTLEKHNLTVPSTMDELYELLVELKKLYPDSYPMESFSASRGYGIPYVIMCSFCVGDSVYYDGEKYAYGPIDYEDRFKAAIEYVRRLYAEGLLQPEFFTQTADALPLKAMNDQTFTIPNNFTLEVSKSYMSDEYPDVVWGIMPIPSGIEGEAPWKIGTNKTGFSYQYPSLVINSEAENIDKLVKLIDYEYSDEIIDISNWGILGESYEIGEDGSKGWTEEVLAFTGAERSKKVSEWGVIGSGYGYPNPLPCWTLDWDARGALWESLPAWDGEAFTKPKDIVGFYGESGSVPMPNDVRPSLATPLTDEEKEFVNGVITACDTAMEEGMIQLISGTKSMDEWDQYIDGIRAMGDIEEVVNIYNRHLTGEQE